MFVSGVVFHLPGNPAADYPVDPRKLRDLRVGLYVETYRNISIRVASAVAATQAFSAPLFGECHQQFLGNALRQHSQSKSANTVGGGKMNRTVLRYQSNQCVSSGSRAI